MSGCSPASYPSIFPAVEETPPPRADTPMDANQVQQATEDLISDRNRLSTEAQGTGQSTTGAAATAKKPTAPDGSNTQGLGGNGTPAAGTESK